MLLNAAIAALIFLGRALASDDRETEIVRPCNAGTAPSIFLPEATTTTEPGIASKTVETALTCTCTKSLGALPYSQSPQLAGAPYPMHNETSRAIPQSATSRLFSSTAASSLLFDHGPTPLASADSPSASYHSTAPQPTATPFTGFGMPSHNVEHMILALVGLFQVGMI